MSLDNINEALEQARKAAAGAAPPSVPAIAAAGATPMAPIQGGRAVSMMEMLDESTVPVDAYLKVVPAAFNIGDDKKTLIEEIKVEFRLSDAKPFYGIRYNSGGSAKYEKSLDRIVNVRSKRSWAQCVAEAQAMDPKCRGDYRGVDIAFNVLETISNAKGDTVLIEEGQRLGWTSSVTNWRDYVEFVTPFYQLIKQGIITDQVMVRGTIKHVERKNSDNEWGCVTFVDFKIVGDGDEQGQA